MNAKKLLAIVLSVTMVLSTMGFTAFAEEVDLVISTTQDLLNFATAVNGGDTYAGKTVVLAEDLDLTGSTWTPIGNGSRNSATYAGNAFKGTFDGQNHTINGLTINDTLSGDAATGFFGVVSGGVVKNLIFTNMSITSNATNTGAIGLAVDGATIENIIVGNASNETSVVNCPDGAAGVLGRLCGTGTIKNCVNYADVTSTSTGGGVGGVVGKAYRPASADSMLVTNCTNFGDVACGYAAGGVVGLSATNVENCANYGEVTAGAEAGGIIGEQNNPTGNNLTISGNVNEGTVTVTNPEKFGAGGIIGQAKTQATAGDILVIKDNENNGSIIVEGTAIGANATDAGGIIGYLYMTDAKVSGNKNTSDTIIAAGYAGGIVGLAYQHVDTGANVTISGNINTATAIPAVGSSNSSNHVIENNPAAFVAKIGNENYATLQEALNAAGADTTIYLSGEINEGSIKLPATISNLTIDGQGTAIIKDTTITAADGSSLDYDGLTINGITFDNSNVVITGWRASESFKNLTFTNNVFKNVVRTSNQAAIHLNNATAYPVVGLTISGNVIDSVSGASNSGIYTTAIDGEIVIENNTIKNVAFRPFVLQITNQNGTADSLTVEGNTFSDSPVGRLQILGTDAAGTDAVNVVLTNNVIHEVINNYELCCWNFNDETTTKSLSGNYWGVGVVDNYDGFYWNGEADSNEALVDLGIFPVYTELNSDGTINTDSIETGEAYAVAKIGDTLYTSLQGAVDAAQDGDSIILIANIELTAQNAQPVLKPVYNRESYAGLIIPDDKVITIDLNGKTLSYVDEYFEVDNLMVLNLGVLTINDSVGGGKMTYKPVAGSSTYSKFYSTIFNCGTLAINGGTIENTCETATDVSNAVDNHSRLSHEYGNDCILTVNGGTLIGAEYRAIRQYTHYFEGVKNRVEINDGTIMGGIYMQHGDSWYYAKPESNRLNVNCELEINGGTITTIRCSDGTDYGHIRSRLANPDNAAWSIEINGGIIEVPVQLQVQRGVYYANGVSGTTVPAEATGARNTEWLAENGGFITGGKFSDAGDPNDVTTNLASFIAEGSALTTTANGFAVADAEQVVDEINVVLTDVTATNAEGEKVYDLKLEAPGEIINRLNSADLTFALNNTSGLNVYEIIASNSEVVINKVAENRYEFHYDGKDNVNSDTAESITIGQVKVTGCGTFTFAVADADTNAAHATKLYDNIVDTFKPNPAAGEGTLNDNASVGDTINVTTRKLTVNIDFNNAVAKNETAYQNMMVEISGGDLNVSIPVALGNDNRTVDLTYAEKDGASYTVKADTDNKYVVTFDKVLTKDIAYNVTVSGEGYRTARYTVTMTDAKTLNFWNNVMDVAQVVEVDKDASATKLNFLAGDILEDNKINIYDLSAVVSYFGQTGTVDNGYAQYDLNRDTVIDSKDVAYVLVSWGN